MICEDLFGASHVYIINISNLGFDKISVFFPVPTGNEDDNLSDMDAAGNADALGTELLESLLKMAPTKEEERKLKECKDVSPTKLGPAEKFLKAVLDVPFAFKRVDAMLYVANFESETEYLKKSFENLEVRKILSLKVRRSLLYD